MRRSLMRPNWRRLPIGVTRRCASGRAPTSSSTATGSSMPRWMRMGTVAVPLAVVGGGFLTASVMASDKEEPDLDATSEGNWFTNTYRNTVDSVSSAWKSFKKSLPGKEKLPLLPPPMPAPYGHKYTLVIDLSCLLHSTWSPNIGWRTRKRPGVDYFLAWASQRYEVVLFAPHMAASEGNFVVETLDANRAADFYFFEEHRKDLSTMNRPLGKVVLVSAHPEVFDHSESNHLLVPEWDGDKKDTALLDLCPLLDELNQREFKDLSKILPHLQGYDVVRQYRSKRLETEKREVQALRQRGPMVAGPPPSGPPPPPTR